jgi:hypothetical protein
LTSRRSRIAGAVFFAFTAPFGIAAHLISELAGLGWHDDADLVLSARHGYLALIALATLGGLFLAFRSLPRGDRRRRVAQLVDDLPFRGRGFGFLALAFVAQFAFFAVTQIGEGCPLCGGDIVVGVFAAAVAALIGAIAVTLGKRRLIALALALVWFVCARACLRRERSQTFDARVVVPRPARRGPFAFRYRPPPVTPTA